MQVRDPASSGSRHAGQRPLEPEAGMQASRSLLGTTGVQVSAAHNTGSRRAGWRRFYSGIKSAAHLGTFIREPGVQVGDVALEFEQHLRANGLAGVGGRQRLQERLEVCSYGYLRAHVRECEGCQHL